MLKSAIKKLMLGDSLSHSTCKEAILCMLHTEVPVEQIAAFLSLLHRKGETVEEILGTISALQDTMVRVPTTLDLVDIVGTGGDQIGTINISTGAAILAASCGVKIAKHGNRAVSSLCGSADVLAKLAIDITMSPQRIATSLMELNIGFCFAPQFHPALAKLRDIRRNLGISTVFNLVGPFLNPASAQHFVLGVYSPKLLPLFAEVLIQLGVKKSVVVHSAGLDEIACSGATEVIEINQSQQKSYSIHPAQFNMPVYSVTDLYGGDATTNAQLLTQTLSGTPGAIADALILNAGMAIYLYGLENNLPAAVRTAKMHLKKGDGLKLLKQWQLFSAAGEH